MFYGQLATFRKFNSPIQFAFLLGRHLKIGGSISQAYIINVLELKSSHSSSGQMHMLMICSYRKGGGTRRTDVRGACMYMQSSFSGAPPFCGNLTCPTETECTRTLWQIYTRDSTKVLLTPVDALDINRELSRVKKLTIRTQGNT